METHSKDFPTLNGLEHVWALESVITDEWHNKIPTIDNEETKQNVYTVINGMSLIEFQTPTRARSFEPKLYTM